MDILPSCSALCLILWLHLVTDYVYAQSAGKQANSELVRAMGKPTESVLIENLTSRLSGRASRPVLEATLGVTVKFGISVVQIQEIDQKKQKLTIHLWKDMSWTDEFLKWDPAQYHDIHSLRLDHDVIWTPDIVLYNTYENRKSDDHDVLVSVKHDGTVSWIPPVIYQSSCPVILNNFPFDVQTCKLEFGSWTYSQNELDLVLSSNNLSMENFIVNVEWALVYYNVTRDERLFACCPDKYVIVTYTFVLRRNSEYYTRVMLMPVLLLSIAAGFIFCIPAQRPDRTVLGLSLFTSFMLLLLLVVDISPPSAESKLSTYLSVYICLVTSAIMLSILLINLSTWKSRMPWCLKTMVLRPMETVLNPLNTLSGRHGNLCQGTQPKEQQQHEDNNVEALPNPGPVGLPNAGPVDSVAVSSHGGVDTLICKRPDICHTNTADWQLLVNLIDRMLFIIYSVCLVVCVTLYFPYPDHTYYKYT